MENWRSATERFYAAVLVAVLLLFARASRPRVVLATRPHPPFIPSRTPSLSTHGDFARIPERRRLNDYCRRQQPRRLFQGSTTRTYYYYYRRRRYY